MHLSRAWDVEIQNAIIFLIAIQVPNRYSPKYNDSFIKIRVIKEVFKMPTRHNYSLHVGFSGILRKVYAWLNFHIL